MQRPAAPRPALDPRIERLPCTTFCGRRLTRRQIADIQATVGCCPQLSRTELGHTICEHLHWQTSQGSNRIQLAMRLLEALERLGIVALPAKKSAGRGRQRPIQPGDRSAPQPPVEDSLASLEPLRLRLVSGREQAAAWNEWIERYHPLGYRQPLGAHLRYFLEDRSGRLLGCLLYDFAARRLPVRDRWIGWQHQTHRRHLDRVVRQARFLLFPWVRVKCLASKALGLSLRQLADDWQRAHGGRPVLVETYVDEQRHKGTCYRASNWRYLGQTQARGACGTAPAKTPKAVFVYPLQRDWQAVLLGRRKTARSRQPARHRESPKA